MILHVNKDQSCYIYTDHGGGGECHGDDDVLFRDGGVLFRDGGVLFLDGGGVLLRGGGGGGLCDRAYAHQLYDLL